MKRLLVSLLAVGLFAASPALLAQDYGDPNYNDPNYEEPYDAAPAGDPGYADSDATGYSDYARVIRVDPVLDDGYATAPGATRRCYSQTSIDRYDRDPYYADHGGYGYGRDPYYDRDPYGDRRYGTRAGSDASAVIGGIIGAVLGSKIGNGSGSYAAAAVGSVAGSLAGRQIYEQRQRENAARVGTVRVCDPEPVRGYDPNDQGYGDNGSGGGYDVTYEYNGRQYTRRMDYNPGDRIRVRVEVTAE